MIEDGFNDEEDNDLRIDEDDGLLDVIEPLHTVTSLWDNNVGIILFVLIIKKQRCHPLFPHNINISLIQLIQRHII
jgi:hypothetical protein